VAKNLRLKAARAEHDMTQGDLAEAVGATRQTIGLQDTGQDLGSTVLGELGRK